MIYGYARVSGNDQNLSRQLEAFDNYGIDTANVFADKMSGKNFERKNYKRLLKKLKAGDLVVVKSIDRLGRNYDGIIEEWSRITSTIGADILVLDMPLLDTQTKTGTLVGKLISDIVLQVLSFVAENERENIRSRQEEGIRLAKIHGVKFGRPLREYSLEFIQTAKGYKEKNVPLMDALLLLKTSKSNFYYHVKKLDTQGFLRE